jgi:hypothetical protein
MPSCHIIQPFHLLHGGTFSSAKLLLNPNPRRTCASPSRPSSLSYPPKSRLLLPLLLEKQNLLAHYHTVVSKSPHGLHFKLPKGAWSCKRTDRIVFQHAQRAMRTRPRERLVVACHGHGNEAHGDRAGFGWEGGLAVFSCLG